MNKYDYYKIIQGNYGYGWEDVDAHECNSSFITHDHKLLMYNLKEYRASGQGVYRVIKRKERKQ